jgi:hypothetical protein
MVEELLEMKKNVVSMRMACSALIAHWTDDWQRGPMAYHMTNLELLVKQLEDINV